jgi:uncharacterized protein YndB with AHSA1/START domain
MQHTETRTVAASAEDVWRILADVERWPTWTRSMTSIELDGPFAVGATARVKQPRLPAVTWEVTALDPGRSFTWQNESVGLHSVGEHTVTAGPAGTSVVSLGIHQTGAMAGIARLLFGPFTRRYVALEADGLQQEAAR